LRNAETNRYWINENLLVIKTQVQTFNISAVVLKVIDAYIEAKKDAFERFIHDMEMLNGFQTEAPDRVYEFIHDLLRPNVDARIFEIVSYAILKEFYRGQTIYWGWTLQEIHEDFLVLYKTGRTNANDGGIDFVMKPLGRFFQVTETIDTRKYFLDIDKIQKFPLTFVIKSTETTEAILARLEAQARQTYGVDSVVKRYLACIDEVINIPILLDRFQQTVKSHGLDNIVTEVIAQSKVEFNY